MTDLKLAEYLELGVDQGRGNLLGVQPYLVPPDYAAEGRFFAKLEGYLQIAQARGWINPRTVAVYPEYTGTWLATTGQRPRVSAAPTLAAAMRALALAHPLALARNLLASREPGRLAAALFRMQAAQMARLYTHTFSELARRYQITIVGGSIVLPAPVVQHNHVVPGRGPLYNITAVFRPDGSPAPELVRKLYPISDEQPFLTAGQAGGLPAFDTPAGRLGVLICADSWYPDAYARLRSLGLDFVAVPSYFTGSGNWHDRWRGYDGAPMPPDVDPGDVRRLSEAQAWRAHALAGRLESSGARCGINVFLHGQLWDMDPAGQSLILRHGEVAEAQTAQAALLNLWL